ncbi:MAG: metal-dependent hydrolase [Pseudomonadota bacterium]
MDPLTHALAGYTIVKCGLNRDTGKWGTIAGITASLFPDIDSLMGLFLGTEFTIKYHRYLTNSLFLAIPFSLFFAWLFVKFSRIEKFRSFFIIWLVEILAHTFLDLVTSYGTMVFSPFTNDRVAFDWIFILDPFLFSIFFFAVVALWIFRRRARAIARTSIALAVLYTCLCAANHFRALSLAKTYARERGLAVETLASLPQPLSPFFWGNYIATGEKIYEGFVNLIGTGEQNTGPDIGLFGRLSARYQPVDKLRYRAWERNEASPWVKKALEEEGVQTFLWFARFPVARYNGVVDGRHRVTLFDLRFGALTDRRPFEYVVDFDQDGNIVQKGFMNRR